MTSGRGRANDVTPDLVDRLAKAIGSLAATLPAGTTQFHSEYEPCRYEAEFKSTRAGTTPLFIDAACPDLLQIDFGQNISLEIGGAGVQADYVHYAVAVCQGVLAGGLQEIIWYAPDGKVIQTKAVLAISGEELEFARYQGRPNKSSRVEKISYAAY